MKVFFSLLILICFAGCYGSADSNDEKRTRPVVTPISLETLSKRAVEDLSKITFDSVQIPRTMEKSGQLKGTPSKSWTSGFYPGLLWQLYGHSGNEKLKQAAMQWSAVVEKEKMDGTTHDLGFKIYCPFGNAYRITNDEKYKAIFLTAAQTLSTRFNPKVKAIRSW
ncbi:MAG: glucuronyl hydrolase, partial [Bacteroidota bacterium]